VLVGKPPAEFSIAPRKDSLTIPTIPPGLPSELLTQRPDIREAEQQLAEADANVEAARAAFFPTIQLTGQGGFSSSVLSALFVQNSGFYSAAVGIGSSVAASTAQTIFDGGLLLGQLDQQKGIREQMLAAYRKAVISAFTDVEKALVGVEQITLQEVLQRRAVAEARKAFDLSEQKLRQGALDLTTLIQVEETLFTQEDMLAQVRFNRLEALVSLYQALGGGWLPRKEAQKP